MNHTAFRVMVYLSVAVGALSVASWALSFLWLAGFAWAFDLGMSVSYLVVLFVWYGVPAVVALALLAVMVRRDD